MTVHLLKARVEARDRLVAQAEHGGNDLLQQVLAALRQGDVQQAEAAIHRHDHHVRTLVENLRIYQAELYAQADELSSSQARTEHLLSQFSALFTHMPVATLLVGSNGEVRESNSQAQRLLALRPEQGSPRFLHRLVDAGDYQARVRPAFHEALSTGASALDSVTFVSDQGRRFPGELHIATLPGQPGEAGLFACAVIDRSEHLNDLRALQESARALHASESFLADSARLARTGGWSYEGGSGALRWSRELQAVFDITDDVPPSVDALLALCHPHSRPALAAGLEAAAHLGQPFELALDMQSAGGRPMRVRVVGHPEGESQGPHFGGGATNQRVIGVVQDITAQHLAHRRIDDLTERLSVANDAGGIGVWDWNVSLDELFFDRRMCRLLDLAEPPTHSLRSVLQAQLQPEDHQRLDAALQRALQLQESLSVEVRLRTEPGEDAERWLHLAGRAHLDAASQQLRLVGCAWDSSPEHAAARLIAAKESAEFASRSKSAFLSRMSHELRTPLNAILGFSQLMRMEADAGDLVMKPHRVVMIETAARHLLDLITEVLDVSRVESGQLELRLSRFDLRPVVAECLPLLSGAADEAGLQLDDLTEQGPPLWVVADRLRLKEVLINLLSNAVKYNRPQGRVAVTALAMGGQIELGVADTGHGLSEQQIAGLYQPFNRLGAESTPVEGSGMGLFVCKRFVELMGGQIRVSSRLGQGSVFTVALKAAPAV